MIIHAVGRSSDKPLKSLSSGNKSFLLTVARVRGCIQVVNCQGPPKKCCADKSDRFVSLKKAVNLGKPEKGAARGTARLMA